MKGMGQFMTKYQALKRLRHLKDFKKYEKLDQRGIDAAKKIFTNNLIDEDPDIILQCSSEGIDIVKTINKGLHGVHIKIGSSGEVSLIPGLIFLVRSFSEPIIEGASDASIIKICEAFRSECKYVEKNKKEILDEFKNMLDGI